MRIAKGPVCTTFFALALGLSPSILSGWDQATPPLVVEGTDVGLSAPQAPRKVTSATAWSGWQRLLGTDQIWSAPAASSYASNRLDVWTIDAVGQVRRTWWNGSDWLALPSLGGESYYEDSGVYSAPAAVSWGSNRIDVFIRGTDSYLYHKAYNGSYWENWQQLRGSSGTGLRIYSAPTVSSWAAGRLDVFAVSSSGSVIHMWYPDSQGDWSDWQILGGESFLEKAPPGDFSAPGAVSWGLNRIDLFLRGTDNDLYHRGYSGRWESWQEIDWQFIWDSGVSAASWASGRLDVFSDNLNSTVGHKYYPANGSWSAAQFFDVGGVYAYNKPNNYGHEAPGAVSWGANRIDLFVRHSSNSGLYHKSWQ